NQGPSRVQTSQEEAQEGRQRHPCAAGYQECSARAHVGGVPQRTLEDSGRYTAYGERVRQCGCNTESGGGEEE
ncbi:hypothetical protein SARC_13435, partial [Sphaeroforma arctica JP610]